MERLRNICLVLGLAGIWLNAGCVAFGQETKPAAGAGVAVSAGPVDDNTVLFFDFGPGDITEDRVADLSGNDNNGKLLNRSSAKWVEGRKGKGDLAVSFDGASWNYLGVASSQSLMSPREGLTIELWVKLNGPVDYPRAGYLVTFLGDDNKNGYSLGLEKDKLAFIIGNGTNTLWLNADAGDALTPDKWHYVKAVWDGKKMGVFVDGRKIAGMDDPFSKPDIAYEKMPRELIIGTRTNAVLDEIKISNIARE